MLYFMKIESEKGAWKMKLELMALPEQNKIMQSYYNDRNFLHTYFDYENSERSFPKRYEELSGRSFNRHGIAETVRMFMEPFGISESAAQHIDELENDAVTVIGGQQAGILTGPLFSIHKAISVILLAKKQRAALGVPVVPVFWVAGEDHDLNEINHVYTESDGHVRKKQIREKFVLKVMASDAVFDQEDMAVFVEEIFSNFGETAYTKPLLEEVLNTVKLETTFTGFFVRLMNGLFAEEGLLFIDSAYKPLRELEREYFMMLIKNSASIAELVVSKEKQFDFDGFGNPLEAQENAANLFYLHETGRVLLSRRNGYFVNDSAGIRFTEEELLSIAKEKPELLSNNVATRPLMQDLVFPVLAFVGGPGEIAYWALLKETFHLFGLKMPIIVPRMSLTLVTRRTAKSLNERSFTFEDVLTGKVAIAQQAYINELRDERLSLAINSAEKLLIAEYEKMGDIVGEEDVMMNKLVQKNLAFHTTQFNYLKGKAEDALLIKHEVALRKFSGIEAELFPDETLQERVYTPYMYLNSYGPELIKDLLRLPMEFDGKHKVVYL